MNRMLRVGVIGAGGNTQARHIPGFQAIPGVAVAAVCNRTRASAEKVARVFSIPQVADNWHDIIVSPDIDAICIGTWPNLHAELAVAALRAGKHVLTEARMARNLAEAKLMLDESHRHPQLVAQIVPAPMSLPFDATVIEQLQAGALGTLREVFLTATSDGLADPAQPLSWRQDATLNGKNTLHLGIYYEMALRWLGHGVTSLVASAAIFTPVRRDGAVLAQTTTVPESVTVLGDYPDGARLVAHFSGVERTSPRAEIRLHGSKAGLRLDLAKGELYLAPAGGPEKLLTIAPEKRAAWNVEADFIASIREGKPVRLTDFATGVEYMRFTEAVWESWNHAGKRVSL
jgi:predicted dehydrogenase